MLPLGRSVCSPTALLSSSTDLPLGPVRSREVHGQHHREFGATDTGLGLIRECGYSGSDADIDQGVRSVAAPIRVQRDDAIATVDIAAPRTRFREEDCSRSKRAGRAATDTASNRLRQDIWITGGSALIC